MISESTFQNAITNSKAFYEQKNRGSLIPVPGTLLEGLNDLALKSLDITANHFINIDDYYSVIPYAIESATGSGTDSPHNTYLDTYTNELSTFVSNHLAFSRNEVLPVITEIKEKCLELANKIPNPTDSVNFTEYSLPGLLTDTKFLSEIAYMENKTPLFPKGSILFKKEPLDKGDYVNRLVTGQSSIDEYILQFIDTVDFTILKDVWSQLFNIEDTDATNVSIPYPLRIDSLDSSTMSICLSTDVALLIYLFSNNKIQNIEATENNLSLKEYKTLLSDYKDYAAATLMANVKRFALYEKANTLILNSDANKSITVYAPVYDRFIANQGTVETILGMAISNRVIYNRDEVLKASDELLNNWKSYCLLYESTAINNYVKSFKISLKGLFIQYGLKNSNVHNKLMLEYCESNPNYWNCTTKKADNYIDRLGFKEFQDIDKVLLDLIAGIMFSFTDSYSIMANMAAIDLLDAREAALLATVNYIADYLSAQIQLR